jgi:hypothetical protein
MDRRILLCGLMAGTFILTFAFSSWRDGLWRHDAAPATRVAPQPHMISLVSKGAPASDPLGTTMTTPTVAVAPAVTPPEPVQNKPQSEPYPTPDADNEATLARGDRGAEHGARSR